MNNEDIGNTTIALKRAQPQAPKQNRQNKTFNRTSIAPISESTRPHPQMCVIYRTDHICPYVHAFGQAPLGQGSGGFTVHYNQQSKCFSVL